MSFPKFIMPEIDEADDEHVTDLERYAGGSSPSDIGEDREQQTISDSDDDQQLHFLKLLDDVEESTAWDTDLEIDDSEKDHDLTGRSQYKKICEELGVVPIEYFIRHITDSCLEMRFHGIGPISAKAMALILRDSVTLECLDLRGNWLECEGGYFIARMLSENDYISEVNLADNRLGSEGAGHICNMLDRNIGLKRLDISANDLGDADIPLFVKVLETNKTLKELNLSRNRFGVHGGQLLGPAIGSNDTLDVLDLSWNHLRHKGAVAVAKGVQENVHLKKCLLAWNGFGSEGGAAIAEAIMVNTSILELDITGNRLDQEVANKISKALKSNDEITVLRMGNNPITTTGALHLIEAIISNPSSSVRVLDLMDVEVECQFLKMVEQIQANCPDFTVTHGPVLRVGNTRADLGKPGVDLDRRQKKDPVELHEERIIINDPRFVEILKKYDSHDDLKVTPDDFMSALQELDVPYDKVSVEKAVEKLTDSNTGCIYFGCFLSSPVDNKDEEDTVTVMSVV